MWPFKSKAQKEREARILELQFMIGKAELELQIEREHAAVLEYNLDALKRSLKELRYGRQRTTARRIP